MRDKFTGLNVPQHLTATIIKFIDLYIKRIELLQVPPADPNRVPDFPLKAVGIAILGIIAFISYPHIVTLLFFAAPTAWVVFFFVRHAEYKRMKMPTTAQSLSTKKCRLSSEPSWISWRSDPRVTAF